MDPVTATRKPRSPLFGENHLTLLYRVAQTERNTYDHLFQENEGQNKQVVCIIAYKIPFSARWHQDH